MVLIVIQPLFTYYTGRIQLQESNIMVCLSEQLGTIPAKGTYQHSMSVCNCQTATY